MDDILPSFKKEWVPNCVTGVAELRPPLTARALGQRHQKRREPLGASIAEPVPAGEVL